MYRLQEQQKGEQKKKRERDDFSSKKNSTQYMKIHLTELSNGDRTRAVRKGVCRDTIAMSGKLCENLLFFSPRPASSRRKENSSAARLVLCWDSLKKILLFEIGWKTKIVQVSIERRESRNRKSQKKRFSWKSSHRQLCEHFGWANIIFRVESRRTAEKGHTTHTETGSNCAKWNDVAKFSEKVTN